MHASQWDPSNGNKFYLYTNSGFQKKIHKIAVMGEKNAWLGSHW